MTQRSGANTEKDASASPTGPANSAAVPSASPATERITEGVTEPVTAPVAAPITGALTELLSGTSTISVEDYVTQLADSREAVSAPANRIVEELIAHKPELLAPHIETLVGLLASPRSRAVHIAAQALPVLARVAPAKVAKHLKTMQAAFPAASELAKDGLVRTFVALCVASVTYQKRLIENFELALRTADAKQLPGWVEHILPALKGEPYAQARSVVEQRLNDPALDRAVAQRVADTIGVKLRALPDRK